jgi:chromosome segregation ATPase
VSEELREAEERARRATERANHSEEAYRKVQLDLVSARDEAYDAKKRVEELEKELAAAKKKSTRPPPPPAENDQELRAQIEDVLARVESLKQLLRIAASELSELHADEAALAGKRTRVLADACALLARAVGESGEAPPPIPGSPLEKRLTAHPSVDISEVAELIESLRPPKAPQIE